MLGNLFSPSQQHWQKSKWYGGQAQGQEPLGSGKVEVSSHGSLAVGSGGLKDLIPAGRDQG